VPPGSRSRWATRGLRTLAGVLSATVVAAGCGQTVRTAPAGVVVAVGAENEYANVIAQIGGPYVQVSAVMSNPNTDPHAFESSPAVASEVATAGLVVQNGLGYDDFMTQIEKAEPKAGRQVVDVQELLGRPDATPNPHLWYSPTTMPQVAAAVGQALSRLAPTHAGYFRSRVAAFDQALRSWTSQLAALRARFGGTPIATTEPVADYLLDAAGLDDRTPFTFQADLMNGTDPTPQDVSTEQHLLAGQVKVLVYNQQVTDPLTEQLLGEARAHHVPVVGVYETMPTGYDYQSWMMAETQALVRALAQGLSAPRL
jgi:zinc/manganese transport system substrate-binding protein